MTTERDLRETIRRARADGAKAAMKRARRVGRDRGVQDGVDYGPGLRLDRGEVVREDRPDIDDDSAYKRTVRGGRRRDGLLLMHKRGEMSDAQWTATERFRDDLALAAGARMRMPGDVGSRSNRSSTAYHPTMAQLDAYTRVHTAWSRVPVLNQPVLSWVVISWGTIGGYEQCRNMRHGRATKLLLDAIDVLADFYSGR